MNSYLSDPLIPETAHSVAEFTAYIQSLLEFDAQLQQVWVTGEVSSANQHRSGHFFTLSDANGTAALRCVVWNSQLSKLMQLPVKGEEILVLGSVRVYPNRGEYQLTVSQILPVGEGLQELRYQQLRSYLQAEGLFDSDRKQPLPLHPQTIAVVTSPQAAAWGDIQRTLKQRYPGLQVLLSPAIVQGNQAPTSIAAAIQRVERDSRAEVIILARGGGAVEDLVCFNDEQVVRAIAECRIPIITGIGHERDESLADLAADVCAHTPTAAAEKAVPNLAFLYLEHQQRVETLIDAVRRSFSQEKNRLQLLKNRLKRLPTTSKGLEQATTQCQVLRQQLAALDPTAVLSRGYAVVRQWDGQGCRGSQGLVPGQELVIWLAQGKIQVKITKILE